MKGVIKKLQQKIDNLNNKKHSIQDAIRKKRFYYLLKSRGNEIHGNDHSREKDKNYRNGPCREWENCCTAQGSCKLKQRHKGPHLQHGWAWTVFFKFSGEQCELRDNEINWKKLPKTHQKISGF